MHCSPLWPATVSPTPAVCTLPPQLLTGLSLACTPGLSPDLYPGLVPPYFLPLLPVLIHLVSRFQFTLGLQVETVGGVTSGKGRQHLGLPSGSPSRAAQPPVSGTHQGSSSQNVAQRATAAQPARRRPPEGPQGAASSLTPGRAMALCCKLA